MNYTNTMLMKVIKALWLFAMVNAAYVIEVNATQPTALVETELLVANINGKCPDIPLMRDADKKMRYLSDLSTVAPLFMSEHYCFLLTGPELPKRVEQYPAQYRYDERAFFYKQFYSAYYSIEDKEQRGFFCPFLS